MIAGGLPEAERITAKRNQKGIKVEKGGVAKQEIKDRIVRPASKHNGMRSIY